jgi:Mrp family chromosome partitioning ATPase
MTLKGGDPLAVVDPQEPTEADEERKLEERLSLIRHKLLVLSGKGGVGKSTVASNLAVSLARSGNKVGLLDIDIHGPSIPKMLGLENGKIASSEEGMLPVQMSENLAVMSIGFMLTGSDVPVIWRGPMKYGVIRQFLKDVAWGPLDYLVVDSPPGTGDEPLSIAQMIGDGAAAVIVTTPQDVAVVDVRRCITFCRKLTVPVVGVVENMSSYVCPRCGDKANLFGNGGGRTLAEEMGVPFLGEIPIDPDILASGETGRPFTEGQPSGPGAQAFANVVSLILGPREALTG